MILADAGWALTAIIRPDSANMEVEINFFTTVLLFKLSEPNVTLIPEVNCDDCHTIPLSRLFARIFLVNRRFPQFLRATGNLVHACNRARSRKMPGLPVPARPMVIIGLSVQNPGTN